MKNLNKYFAGFMFVILSISILGLAGYSNAADVESAHDRQAILEGAKQMLDGNKVVVDIMTKKGKKDADLTAAEKMMSDGYNMVVKGESMMTGSTTAEGKDMVTRGANMMMAAEKATKACVEKHGMVQECSGGLDTCAIGDKKVKAAFQTYGLSGNWEEQR